MFRVVHVLLTITGLLVCPFVCNDAAAHSFVAKADHGQTQTKAKICHCSHGCCGDRAQSKNQPRSPDKCGDRACVCQGALVVAHECNRCVVPDLVVAFDQVAPQVRDLASANVSNRILGGPPLPPLPDGRAVRLAIESLLL